MYVHTCGLYEKLAASNNKNNEKKVKCLQIYCKTDSSSALLTQPSSGSQNQSAAHGDAAAATPTTERTPNGAESVREQHKYS